ncbi:FG-GAP repeat protein [Pontiella sulfatireligans]|nr:FG-GAP repeat protein [Pontiella sulfatireligans]
MQQVGPGEVPQELSAEDWTAIQEAYLKASNTDAGDHFGCSVDFSGDTAVVGARRESSSATAVNGNQADNGAEWAGAAYVFVRSGTNWQQQAYLKPSNTDAYDWFGNKVAISGNTIVIGGANEDSIAKGVNGNQTDNSASGSGAAYVFVRSGTNWSQQAYLKASNTQANDRFSYSVAISGDTIVVGADSEDSNASGVNGVESDNSAISSGATYVFGRNGSNWCQQAYLKASNTEAYDRFGYSVAISGDTIVVGAYAEDSNASGVNGNQNDNNASGSGAAYVFVRNGTNWLQQAYLKASNTEEGDSFGCSAAILGDTILVGAENEDSATSGMGGNPSDNSATSAGAAYVYVRTGTNWNLQAYIKASDTQAGDVFGRSVAMSGNNMVIGAPGEDSGGTSAGAAYVYERTATTWIHQARLKASYPANYHGFGNQVALSGNCLVIGAYGENSSATGVNGNQNDNSAIHSGAAYVFSGGYLDTDDDRIPDAWELLYFSSATGCIASGNADLDPQSNYEEYIAGTDPTNAATFFAVAVSNQVDGFVIRWTAVEGRVYHILRGSDLMRCLQPLVYGLAYPQNSYTDSVHNAASCGYYRVMVTLPDADDADGDCLPHIWEDLYFGDEALSNPHDDPDGDGHDNIREYISGTDPISKASCFTITHVDHNPGAGGYVVQWESVSNRQYSILWTDTLSGRFQTLEADIEFPQNSYTDTLHGARDNGFYQLEVELKE